MLWEQTNITFQIEYVLFTSPPNIQTHVSNFLKLWSVSNIMSSIWQYTKHYSMSYKRSVALKLYIGAVMANFMRIINGKTSKLCKHAFEFNYTKHMI